MAFHMLKPVVDQGVVKCPSCLHRGSDRSGNMKRRKLNFITESLEGELWSCSSCHKIFKLDFTESIIRHLMVIYYGIPRTHEFKRSSCEKMIVALGGSIHGFNRGTWGGLKNT